MAEAGAGSPFSALLAALWQAPPSFGSPLCLGA